MNSEDPDFTAALLGFNGEAVLYCQGISEPLAHDYALDYWRMIGDRLRGIEVSFVRAPFGLFEPNRNLIRATLERMSEKYFPLRQASPLAERCLAIDEVTGEVEQALIDGYRERLIKIAVVAIAAAARESEAARVTQWG